MSFPKKDRWSLHALAAVVVTLLLSAAACDKYTGVPQLTLSAIEAGHASGSVGVSVKAPGKWTLEFGGQCDWAELSRYQGSGIGTSTLYYGENDTDSIRTLKIILKADGITLAKTFSQLPEGTDPGGGDPNPPGIPVWMELPKMQSDGGPEFFSHDMRVGGIPTRNYSFYWDDRHLLAHWVAYPLSNWNIGTGDRTDAWGYDPKVPKDRQPNYKKGIRGFDRGHQLPSADRYGGNNPSTFYYTNMTPQRGSLNQKKWAELEGEVRNWARKSDTLYVVTGCVVKGSSEKAYDNDGKAVTVPVAYYKAILRYSRSSSSGNSGYMGLGIYMRHEAQSGSLKSYSMSIDELETLTDMDFFPNLASVLGVAGAASVESEDPAGVSWWW